MITEKCVNCDPVESHYDSLRYSYRQGVIEKKKMATSYQKCWRSIKVNWSDSTAAEITSVLQTRSLPGADIGVKHNFGTSSIITIFMNREMLIQISHWITVFDGLYDSFFFKEFMCLICKVKISCRQFHLQHSPLWVIILPQPVTST